MMGMARIVVNFAWIVNLFVLSFLRGLHVIRVKGFIYILLFNILVSATVTLAVLYYWDLARLGEGFRQPTPMVIYIPVTGTPPTLAADLAALLPATESTPLPPSETPTPYEVRTEPYRVQPGDSLGQIANRYDISLADLLAVNDLEDPDQLFVGQIILIPLGPLPTNTPFIPTATTTPTVTSTPRLSPTPSRTPTRTPNQGEPVIRIDRVLGSGDHLTERVLIVHEGGRDVSLFGWKLTSRSGNQFTFPQLTLREGSQVAVHTRSGQDSVSDLYWGQPAAVWLPGERATLVDANGEVVDMVSIP
jgi:LysM repeat protein